MPSRTRQPRPEPVECPRCGQRANQPPGFKLRDYDTLEAIFVGGDENDEAVLTGPNLPQQLVCQNCGWHQMVPRGSIEVRRP